jgi:DNA-binding IclR family transcriptional regulator
MGFLFPNEREALNILKNNPQGLYLHELAKELGIGTERTLIRLEGLMVSGQAWKNDEGRYFPGESSKQED